MPDLAREYRTLLTDDASEEGVDRVLSLLERLTGIELHVRDAELRLQKLNNKRSAQKRFPTGLHEALRSLDLPEFVRSVGRRRRRPERVRTQERVLRATAALGVLPDLMESQEDSLSEESFSLFLDSCLLLFHNVYFALLPRLPGRTWANERSSLLQASRKFALHIQEPADRFRVMALTLQEAGNADEAALFYRRAVDATHTDSHEFMSVLQLCWTHLVECAQYRQALELLVDAYQRVPRKDLEEMKDLILTTHDLASVLSESAA